MIACQIPGCENTPALQAGQQWFCLEHAAAHAKAMQDFIRRMNEWVDGTEQIMRGTP